MPTNKNFCMEDNSKEINWPISKMLAHLVEAREGHCASNVARVFAEFQSELPPGAQYCEGVWQNGGGQDEVHAWIEVKELIIDPTVPVVSHRELRRSQAIIRCQEFDGVVSRYNSALEAGTKLYPIIDMTDSRCREVMRRWYPGFPI